MSYTVFLGNLPLWVTADDIKSWLASDNLVADNVKVIRNPETQESKGFAFIEAPNQDEMNSIIRRFDRAPLEERLLRANPAQPPKPKSAKPAGNGAGASGPQPRNEPREFRNRGAGGGAPAGSIASNSVAGSGVAVTRADGIAGAGASRDSAANNVSDAGAPTVPPAAVANTGAPSAGAATKSRGPRRERGPQSAFAEELAKAL